MGAENKDQKDLEIRKKFKCYLSICKQLIRLTAFRKATSFYVGNAFEMNEKQLQCR